MMISKKTKKALALTLSLGVVVSSTGVINPPVVACAEDAGTSSSEGDGQASNNEESDNFEVTDGELTQSINHYIHGSDLPENISKDNISSIINEFSYGSHVTTGSAVTIKAKDILNFKNDGSTLSFNGTLYEDKEGGATSGFSYSNTYNQPLMLSSNLLTSENTSEWTTTEDIKTSTDKTVIINGVKFKLNEDESVSVSGFDSDGINTYLSEQSGLVKLPNIISYGENKYSVTSIGDGAFAMCSSLESIEIPSSVTSIGDGAFAVCSSLESIEIPSSVTSIGNYVFQGCSGLKSIEIPSSVESIGIMTFYECSSLENIEIPLNVTKIGEGAFNGCSKIKSIKIPSGVKSIEKATFFKCSNLKSIEIPSSVTSIGDAAFRECTSLKNIQIPSSVISIGAGLFEKCSSLENVEMPDSVTNIGEGVFINCNENLTAFLYKILDDKSGAEITGIYEDSSIGGEKFIGNTLIIPDTICGIKVTGIKEGLFDDYTDKITDITCYDAKIKEQIEKIPRINKNVTASMSNYSISGDTSVIYDGKPHSIVVNGAPSGTSITYRTTTGSAVEYTAVNPKYTEKGAHTVYYKVSGGGYDDEKAGSAVLNIVENPVQSIEISAEGGVNAVSIKGGSLKLTGVVNPSDAGIPALKWTIVSGQDLATISEAGVLTANGTQNGTVTALAEATDGSGIVSNELLVTLKNQVSSSGGGSSSGGSSSSSSSSGGSSSSSSDKGEAKTGNGTEGNKAAVNGWNLIDGSWYMLDRTTGVMITGWFRDTDGSWYYLEPKSKKMVTGWFQDVDGKWYYLKASGAMDTGWIKDTDGKWYYLYANGSMAYDTYVDGYYVGNSGAWIS